MANIKTDGKFIISDGGITQGIQKELGLSNEECKKLGSVWAQIINEFDGQTESQANMAVTNNRGKTPSKSNGYSVAKDAVVEFSKECWQRIVTLVNNKLGKNIEIVQEELPENAEVTEETEPNSELDSWFLDGSNYVKDPDDEYITIDEYLKYDGHGASNGTRKRLGMPSKEASIVINEWYENYKKENGEMNFNTAMKYLNDNPDLQDEIKEYIKSAFGICDGDITNNRQGSKGTCHLLSCKAELDACEELRDIVDKIVVQNDDGTVTVTFFGVKDENGDPWQTTITNKEIRESYRYVDEAGSLDPDAAVLELAYVRFVSEMNEKAAVYETERATLEAQRVDIRKKKFMASINKLYENLRNSQPEDEDLKKLKEYLENNIDKINAMSDSEFIDSLEEYGVSDIFYDNLPYDFEEYNQLNSQEMDLAKRLHELSEKYKDCEMIQRYDKDDEGNSLGGNPKITFEILTGKTSNSVLPSTTAKLLGLPEDWHNQENGEEMRQYLLKVGPDLFLSNVNIESTPIIIEFKEDNYALNVVDEHAYSLKDIYVDEDTGEKMAVIHNPWGFDVTMKYSDMIDNILNISYIEL